MDKGGGWGRGKGDVGRGRGGEGGGRSEKGEGEEERGRGRGNMGVKKGGEGHVHVRYTTTSHVASFFVQVGRSHVNKQE